MRRCLRSSIHWQLGNSANGLPTVTRLAARAAAKCGSRLTMVRVRINEELKKGPVTPLPALCSPSSRQTPAVVPIFDYQAVTRRCGWQARGCWQGQLSSASAPGRAGMRLASSWTCSLSRSWALLLSISPRWPSNPKPVMSVAACSCPGYCWAKAISCSTRGADWSASG